MLPMHHDLQLIAPSDDMQETYEDFLRDFRSTGEMLIPWVLIGVFFFC